MSDSSSRGRWRACTLVLLLAAGVGCVDLRRPAVTLDDGSIAVSDASPEPPADADPAPASDAGPPSDGPPGPQDTAGAPADAPAADTTVVDAPLVDAPPVDAPPVVPDAPSSPDTAPPPVGLGLYWRFDEPDGEPAADGSGNGRVGTYVGAGGTSPRSTAQAAPVTFANPASRTFAGASRQAVLLANMPAALRPTTELTLAAWYRASSLDPSVDASELISCGNNHLLRLRADEIEVSKRVARAGGNQHVRCLVPASSHVDGRWHHLAAVIGATIVTLYFDGAAACALANSDPLAYDQGNDLWVGRHPTSESYDWNGEIDEVRLYTRALSSAEIAALATRAP